MVATPSTMVDLGTQAPDFNLTDVVRGDRISLDSFSGKKALLVMFISRHCPYVQHIQDEIARIGRDYADRGVGVVGICSNDVEKYPDDSPEMLREMAERLELGFPVCHDPTQEVAKAYAAACTPDFFVFDAGRKLVYRGQLDASRPGNEKPVTGRDLRDALEAVLSDRKINEDQLPSLGCNIKWKPGNEPAYFK